MPGVAFHFTVLDLVRKNLSGSKKNIIEKNLPYAYLGAMGPDLLSYIPADKEILDLFCIDDLSTLGQQDYPKIWPRPVMTAYGTLFRMAFLDAWETLEDLHAFLDRMDAIAATEDTEQLKQMKGELDSLTPKIAELANMKDKIEKGVAPVIGLAEMAFPLIQGNKYPWLQQLDRPNEFLRWHRTAQYARNLEKTAGNDERLLAYAFGYMVHVAASVTGEPFVNNIVGGPYRTHWWRNRLIRNSVDTWTFGFQQLGQTVQWNGDTPSPSYDTWPNLCNAALHEKNIQLDGAMKGSEAARMIAAGFSDTAFAQFPPELAKMLDEAFKATYSGVPYPKIFDDPSIYEKAYVGAIAILWFMTGARTMQFPGTPPCGLPDWVTQGGTPPPATQSNPKKKKTTTYSILAIIFFLFGQWGAGIAAAGAAIDAALAGDVIDWAQLRCNLYWLRYQLVLAENNIRSVFTLSTLAYPTPTDLGRMYNPNNLANQSGGPLTAQILCKTVIEKENYPQQMDASVKPTPTSAGAPDLNYLNPPVSPLEKPLSWCRIDPHQYPEYILNKSLANGGMLSGDTSTFFGGAVANALQLLDDASKLIDFNLDGDRGYGEKTWNPKKQTYPNTGTVEITTEP